MNKILVVEDNKTLAKLIAKKIESNTGFEVDVAYKLSEAKLFFKMYKYFVVLADLNLPDAADGEVVDYALSKGNRVIVLSGSVDASLRESLLKKNILDYINKTGVNNIDYIIETVKRLQKNQNHKVLLVDPSMVVRKQMKEMLENLFFNVITVAHGEEALGMLNTHPDISMMITDYNMPVMNGLDLTIEARKIKSKKELCIIAVSSNKDESVNALFLKSGANDYIKKPFSKEEFSCRVNNAMDALEDKTTVANIANRDFLTGLYNRPSFFKDMQKYFLASSQNSEKYALALIDIDNFKHINNNYGNKSGDEVIIHLSELIKEHVDSNSIVARFAGDEFCVVLQNIEPQKAIKVFEDLNQKVEASTLISEAQHINYTISIGLTTRHDFTLDGTIHEADVLLFNAKENGKNQVIHD